MNSEAQNVFEKVQWVPFDDGMKIIIPFLQNNYKNNREFIDKWANEIKIILDKQKDQIFEIMEKLTKYPILHDKFTIWYTTCKRWPYNWETWEIWMFEPSKIERRLRSRSQSFSHELLHIQTHKYYQFVEPMNQLNFQQFNLIKESLTFLLNHEFTWINMAVDRWYPQHQEYRKILEDYRLSCWNKKDFKNLINYGCSYIIEHHLLEW